MFGTVLTSNLWANMGRKKSYLKLFFNKKEGIGVILKASQNGFRSCGEALKWRISIK
jgi:hypothetical protein